MGEDSSQYALLKKASEEELFHLQNGVDIATIRELLLQLTKMSKDTFLHHVYRDHNDFALWVDDVFGDKALSKRLANVHTKEETKELIEQRILELEEKELKKYGVNIPVKKLRPLEDYIEDQLSRHCKESELKKKLLTKGWKKRIIELVLEGRDNPYRDYDNVSKIENVEHFHDKLQTLKKHILNAVRDGSSIQGIKESLKRQGWHSEIIDFIFFDVYKPHPNIRKLGEYIIYQVREKNKEIDEVKETLAKLGWKEYLIDSVIYGVKEPDNSLDKILSYVDSYAPKDHDRIKAFLLEMGWSEPEVREALRKRELQLTKKNINKSLNVNQGEDLKQRSEKITPTLFRVQGTKETQGLWKNVKKQFKAIAFSDLKQDESEVHVDAEYEYYYPVRDFEKIVDLENKNISNVFYLEPTKPIFVELGNKYIILPQVIKRRCMVSGKLLPVTEMKRIHMWDKSRTQKIVKYVSPKYEDQVNTFLGTTRIFQS